jgi:serine O-acetyltransferase
MGLVALVREDLATHRGDWTAPGFQALAVHRFGYWASTRQGVAGAVLRRVHRTLFVAVRNVYGIELPAAARIGRRMHLGHAHGIIVNAKTEFGDDCVLSHNVTTAIGAPGRRALPRVGNRVTIGPNVVLVGRITVGDDASIGANALVLTDVPAGGTVERAPTRVLFLERPATASPA